MAGLHDAFDAMQRRPGFGKGIVGSMSSNRGRSRGNPPGRRYSKRLRRLLAMRFPGGLAFRVEAEQLFVVAVAPVRHRPGYHSLGSIQ